MFQNETMCSNCNEQENVISPNCHMRHYAKNFKNGKKNRIVFNMNARERMLPKASKTDSPWESSSLSSLNLHIHTFHQHWEFPRFSNSWFGILFSFIKTPVIALKSLPQFIKFKFTKVLRILFSNSIECFLWTSEEEYKQRLYSGPLASKEIAFFPLYPLLTVFWVSKKITKFLSW